MELTKDDVRNLAKTINLDIPEDDLNTVALRLSSALSLMELIEAEMGKEMDKVDPIPPVYPREEF
jgi:Asp-tRNA(Asn)/Glu-tRNA(Gln) amidotransferase C subunit